MIHIKETKEKCKIVDVEMISEGVVYKAISESGKQMGWFFSWQLDFDTKEEPSKIVIKKPEISFLKYHGIIYRQEEYTFFPVSCIPEEFIITPDVKEEADRIQKMIDKIKSGFVHNLPSLDLMKEIQ